MVSGNLGESWKGKWEQKHISGIIISRPGQAMGCSVKMVSIHCVNKSFRYVFLLSFMLLHGVRINHPKYGQI